MADPGAWGIEPGYHDTAGHWHQAPESTVAAVLAAMGTAGAGEDTGRARAHPDGTDRAHPDDDPTLVLTVRLDHPLPPIPPGRIVLEDAGELPAGGPLPPDVPVGYHQLVPDDGPPRTLVVSPGRCPQPDGARWGWAAQLYATRSTSSWGIGDLADLRRLTRWGAGLGARVTLVNPLHAGPPGPQPQPSPYFPSSRCFSDPIYLRVEDVPGAEVLAELGELQEAGRALNAERRIDRERVWALKSAALERLFGQPGADDGLDAYLCEGGATLAGFATFNALAEREGLPWQSWPAALRHPGSPAVRDFVQSEAGRRRVRFHAWLQRQLDRQLAATRPAELIADLAVGADAGGADAWLWQETLADGIHIGAPPDDFNRHGQDWGLPPWDPWRLRAGGYEPFVRMVRAALRFAGGLRVDHVMGLFRLFWIPDGAEPAAGVYVRYPYWDLLNILALEAHRAGAYVVGEDLGTVEDRVRDELRARGVLSYRLLWFERERPPEWPPAALGAVTTHDLPTVAGVWTGADIEAQRSLGLEPNEAGAAAMRDRLVEWAGAGDGTPVEEVVAGAYGALAEAPCRVLTVALEDLAGVVERPNMPGTTDEWPNWSLALPAPLEELEGSPLVAGVAARMNTPERAGRPTDKPPQ